MQNHITYPERHARLFELIRQQNLMTSKKTGHQAQSSELKDQDGFIAAAQASLKSA